MLLLMLLLLFASLHSSPGTGRRGRNERENVRIQLEEENTVLVVCNILAGAVAVVAVTKEIETVAVILARREEPLARPSLLLRRSM